MAPTNRTNPTLNIGDFEWNERDKAWANETLPRFVTPKDQTIVSATGQSWTWMPPNTLGPSWVCQVEGGALRLYQLFSVVGLQVALVGPPRFVSLAFVSNALAALLGLPNAALVFAREDQVAPDGALREGFLVTPAHRFGESFVRRTTALFPCEDRDWTHIPLRGVAESNVVLISHCGPLHVVTTRSLVERVPAYRAEVRRKGGLVTPMDLKDVRTAICEPVGALLTDPNEQPIDAATAQHPLPWDEFKAGATIEVVEALDSVFDSHDTSGLGKYGYGAPNSLRRKVRPKR